MNKKKSAPVTEGNEANRAKAPSAENGGTAYALFSSLDRTGQGEVLVADLASALERLGLGNDDPRLSSFFAEIDALGRGARIDFNTFQQLIKTSPILVQKALQKQLIIPEFEQFRDDIKKIFASVAKNTSGKVADYIPQLAKVDPNQFGISVCTVDGQRFSFGDSDQLFSIQSTSKPTSYLIALALHGSEKVHRHVGREPSGHSFNAITLDGHNRPHNPMINAGAILCSSLINPESDAADRFDYVLNTWQRLFGGKRPDFNNSIYLSEKNTADRNFALAYFMREKKVFPPESDLHQALDLYFQCCSISATCENMAVSAATLANAGICPLTNDRVFEDGHVKDTLSLMYSCGMYDFSGEFAFLVGLPAKSGVSGVVQLVIPNVMGIAIWSPKLDIMGNSVRGVEFCIELVKRYNFHTYDTLIAGHSSKSDPRLRVNQIKQEGAVQICWAAANGDLSEIQRLIAAGVDVKEADYDGRTALHLAASEGHDEIVKYLLGHGADLESRDRWGGTPLDDAKRHSRSSVIELIEGRTKKQSISMEKKSDAASCYSSEVLN
jgi:glutaminase